MVRCRSGRWVALLTVFALAGCHSAARTNPTPVQSAPTPTSATAAPTITKPGALFYTKGGSLYVSDPAGNPGRKLTDGPADTQPAPSPDLTHVAFVRKARASDYGGELWVLDLSPQLTPIGPAMRLVDPAALPWGTAQSPAMIASPRWSPRGQHVAFVDNGTGGMVDGGLLIVAAADTGGVVQAAQPLAEAAFARAPDGSHIAWLDARSDVRPADVSVLSVGGESTPVAAGTNASSVTYAKDGQTILFANGDTTDPDMFPKNPFDLRTGGVYSVAASAGSGAKPLSPAPLFTGQGSYYTDIAALDSGAVAFTSQGITRGAPSPSKAIQVLDEGSSLPQTMVTDVATAAQGPAWGAGDFAAYINASTEKSLMLIDLANRTPRRVDMGVDSFAWAPPRQGF